MKFKKCYIIDVSINLDGSMTVTFNMESMDGVQLQKWMMSNGPLEVTITEDFSPDKFDNSAELLQMYELMKNINITPCPKYYKGKPHEWPGLREHVINPRCWECMSCGKIWTQSARFKPLNKCPDCGQALYRKVDEE